MPTFINEPPSFFDEPHYMASHVQLVDRCCLTSLGMPRKNTHGGALIPLGGITGFRANGRAGSAHSQRSAQTRTLPTTKNTPSLRLQFSSSSGSLRLQFSSSSASLHLQFSSSSAPLLVSCLCTNNVTNERAGSAHSLRSTQTRTLSKTTPPHSPSVLAFWPAS